MSKPKLKRRSSPRPGPLNPNDLLTEGALRILRRNNAPGHWGTFEADVLLHVIMSPGQIHTVRYDGGGYWFPKVIGDAERGALLFSSLMAIAPDTVTKSWGQILDFINSRLQSPEFCVAYRLAGGVKSWKKLWTAGKEAHQGIVSGTVTDKVVEHARARVRHTEKFKNEFPPNT